MKHAFRALLAALTLLTPAFAAPGRPQLKVTAYIINAEIDPAASRLTATAQVTFTALEDLTNPVFELNNGLALSNVTDASHKPLVSERLTPQNAVRFTLDAPIPKGSSTTWTSPTPASSPAPTPAPSKASSSPPSPTPSRCSSTRAVGSQCPPPASTPTVSPPRCTFASHPTSA